MAEPPITIQAAHTSGGPNLPAKRIVIHATSPGMTGHQASKAGMALSTARYFAGVTSGGSAHYIVDVGPAEQHCVKDNTVAWHAPPNGFSIGIEICADSTYSGADWHAIDVWPAVVNAAKRTAELCERHRVPMVRIGPSALRAGEIGVCSHHDVSEAWHQTDHWDPGDGFPWDEFMALVTGAPAEEDDDVKPSDIVDEIKVSDRAFYQLRSDGGVNVVGRDRRPADNEPFHDYYVVADDGSAYYFGADLNDGVFSYPGLPADARQGNRRFVTIQGDS